MGKILSAILFIYGVNVVFRFLVLKVFEIDFSDSINPEWIGMGLGVLVFIVFKVIESRKKVSTDDIT